MKNLITIAILLISAYGIAQIRGNKKIVTRTYDVKNTEVIKINLYSEVVIDYKSKESLTITTDENLFEYINKSVVNNVLHLEQNEWIKASSKIKIVIGAPNLKVIETGTHDIVDIINVNSDKLKIIAPIGNINVNGTANFFELIAKNGDVDASKLIAKNANIIISGRSRVNANVVNELNTDISNNARFTLVNNPNQITGNYNPSINSKLLVNKDLKWISFKLKNNSWNRNKFVVIGPKKDGSQFSYGFAMMPGTSKKERLSIGTKVYRDKGMGVKEHLLTVNSKNENEVVKLFKD